MTVFTSTRSVDDVLFAPNINLIQTYTKTDIQNAVNYAMSQNPYTGKGGGAYGPRQVHLKAGVYEIDGAISYERIISQDNIPDQQSLVITGEGKMNTILRAQASGLTMFTFKNIRVGMRGIEAIGYATSNDTKFMSLGDAANFKPVSQFHLKDLLLYGMNVNVEIAHAFDGLLEDIGMFGMVGTNPLGVDIKAHATDNSNFINFNRIHMEQSTAGTFFRSRSSLGATQMHQNMNWFGCHFESKAFNQKLWDCQGLVNSGAWGCVFTQNNTIPGNGSGLTIADLVPAFTFDSSWGILLQGGAYGLVGAAEAAHANKVFKLTGATRGIVVQDMFIQPVLSATSPGLNELVDNQSSITVDPIKFRDVFVQDRNHAPINGPIKVSSPATGHGNREYVIEAVDNAAGNTDLIIEYASDANGQTKTVLGRLSSTSGVLLTGGLSAPYSVSLANNANATYTIPNPDGGNSNKRGMFFIWEQGSGQDCWAIVVNSGSHLSVVASGANTAVADADPTTASKLSVFLNGANISLTNRLGSTFTFCIMPFLAQLAG